MRAWMCAMCAVAAMSAATATAAPPRMLTIVGYVEEAVILPEGFRLKAHMGTSVMIASLHALEIERITRNGQDWVRFRTETEGRALVLERRVEQIVRVRRAGISIEERPVVRLGLCIAGYFKQAAVTLNDRSRMPEPLLVGRQYMSSGGLVVDSDSEFEGEPDCPGTSITSE